MIALLWGKAGEVVVAAAPPVINRDVFWANREWRKTPLVRAEREPSRQEIEREAYYIWLREGKPEGQAMRHWLQAEQKLRGRR